MRETILRDVVDEHWSALSTEPASGERRLRVSELPVATVNGSLAVAIDHDGHRHVLVPIASQQRVRRGLDGPVLRLSKRALEDEDSYRTYADLGCLRSDLEDLFTVLCGDVLAAAAALSDNPLKALYRVLDRWKALFQTNGAPLGIEQLAGLFGELTVLNRLLEQDPSAHRFWRGPHGHRHDFASSFTAIEVKSSMRGEGRRPRIHGLDQLEAPTGGALHLVWYRLERATETGTAFADLVNRALRLCDDESALLALLAGAGYRSSDLDRYHDVRFAITEERWHEVDADFPKLTGRDLARAGIPVAALDVEYTIDLSGAVPAPMDADKVTEVLRAVMEEPV
ncbi:PD-(D/E)XK motif protein [Streptomyces sp. Y1]|uniref:PD-(D/E)XK motif protein n=1 Tax=Streptomyces sp. Y1 TaxID=3238634 RepID=A0AB39TS35_9ACTN